MGVVRRLVTQSAADVLTSKEVVTGLTADGRSLWEITALECWWKDGAAVAAADFSLLAFVSTVDPVVVGLNGFADDEFVEGVSWGLQNTGGVAVAVPYEPYKRIVLHEPRITAQPSIFIAVYSNGTSQANDVDFRVHYNIVRASDLEVLRLMAGGA